MAHCKKWVTVSRVNAEITSEILNQVFSSAPALSWVSSSELVDLFSAKIVIVVNTIAPTKVKVIPCKTKL